MPVAKIFLTLGAVLLALAVVAGAFGAHALRARLAPDLLAVYQTAVQYHFYHAFGLLAVGLLVAHFTTSPWFVAAGGLMVAGLLFFSGSLYALSLSGVRLWGAVAPIGGMAFILAWIALAIGVWRANV